MFQDVLDFHVKLMPELVGSTPATPSHSTAELRYELMREELRETFASMCGGDLPGVADGLADLIYVALGCAVSYGIDLRPVFEAVHAANMAKEGGSRRADNKLLKPPGWKAPDIAGILAKQGPLTGGQS
jgi:predicted HAD superfamily Cof-like phosphohydrolase